MRLSAIFTTIACVTTSLIIMSSPVNATLIRCVFEGDVGYAFDNTGTIDFTAINSYSGELVYESSTANTGVDPSWGQYDGAIKEFTVTLGSSVFSLLSPVTNNIDVINRSWDFVKFHADLVGPGAIGTIPATLELTDQDGLALTSVALPTSLNLSDFNSPVRLLLGRSDDDFYVNGSNLTKFEARPVPEPATMLLLSAGLAGLGAFRKKFGKV